MHGILAVNHTATLTNQIRIDPNVYNGARVISNDVANRGWKKHYVQQTDCTKSTDKPQLAKS